MLVQKTPTDNEATTKKEPYYFALKKSRRFKELEKDKANSKDDSETKIVLENEISFFEVRELMISKRLSRSPHKNIINFLDFKVLENETWILMEYMPINLLEFYGRNKKNPNVMNERFFKNIAYQILSGIKHLHSEQIIHRDIKLENILYDEKNNIVKIGDFGLGRLIEYNSETEYTTELGTLPYKPPEVLLGLKQYSTGFDIWSTGCVLVHICTMKYLFGAHDPVGVLKYMYEIFGSFNDDLLPGYRDFPNGNLVANLPEKEGIGLVEFINQKKKFEFENDNFYDLIKKMLFINPNKRITAEGCLSHPWFSNIDVI